MLFSVTTERKMEDGEKSYRDHNHSYFLESLKFCPHTQLEKVKGMHAEN